MKNLIKNILASLIVIFSFNQACAQPYEYQKKTNDKNIIHILKINPSNFQARLVRANDDKGRETVSSLATRHAAEIAINGGFFEIGGDSCGKPSFTLIVDDRVYNMKDRDQPLIVISSGTMSIEYSNPAKIVNTNMSAVSGIPMLIENGNVVENLSSVKSNFYSKPHARTAIGIDNRKNIIIVVAEHYYSRDGNNFTMGELKSLLKTKGKLFVQIYNKKDPYDLTLKELRDILKDEFSSNDKTQGLTIVELANLMKGLGCQKAINLDGGGSSTLWIKGQVINTPIGDIDESNGSKIERPVSDAILFVDAHK